MNEKSPFYFRQLLSGRDFAKSDLSARQMSNFVYLLGDKETKECMIIDPAYNSANVVCDGNPGSVPRERPCSRGPFVRHHRSGLWRGRG